jgi:hypothetical protein
MLRAEMKCPSLIATLLSVAVLFASCGKNESRQAASDVASLHKWLIAYSLDSGGKFPDNIGQLLNKSYGADEEVIKRMLPRVIEYRGKGMSNADDASLVLCRYQVDDGTEARLTVSGIVKTGPLMPPSRSP